MESHSVFAEGLPESVITGVLSCLNCSERKIASLTCTVWRAAFLRKNCMQHVVLRVSTAQQCDKLSNLLQYVRHLRVKAPVNLIAFKQSAPSESYRHGLAFYAASFCKVLNSIELCTDYVPVSIDNTNEYGRLCNTEGLLEGARSSLRTVRRICTSSNASVLWTYTLLNFLRLCPELEDLDIDIRSCHDPKQDIASLLLCLTDRIRFLSIRFSNQNGEAISPVAFNVYTSLALRGIHLRKLELFCQFAEATNQQHELHSLQLAHPSIALKLNIQLTKAELHLGSHRLGMLLADLSKLEGLRVSVDLSYFDNYFCNDQRRQFFESVCFDNLKSFSTDLSTEYTDIDKTLAKRYSSNRLRLPLRRLDVEYEFNIVSFISCFSNLRCLTVTRRNSFGDAEIDYELDALALGCPLLEKLSLESGMLLFSDTHKITKFAALRKLTVCAVWTNQRSSRASPSLSRVGSRLRISAPLVEKLRLLIQVRGGFTASDVQRWQSAVSACPSVQSASLFAPFPDGPHGASNSCIPASWWFAVSAWRHLRSVCIFGNPSSALGHLPAAVTDSIASCRTLKQLKFRISSDSEYQYYAGESDLADYARLLPQLSVTLSIRSKRMK